MTIFLSFHEEPKIIIQILFFALSVLGLGTSWSVLSVICTRNPNSDWHNKENRLVLVTEKCCSRLGSRRGDRGQPCFQGIVLSCLCSSCHCLALKTEFLHGHQVSTSCSCIHPCPSKSCKIHSLSLTNFSHMPVPTPVPTPVTVAREVECAELPGLKPGVELG